MRGTRARGSAVLAAVLLGIVVSTGGAATPRFQGLGGVTETSTFSTAKTLSGQVAQTDPSLLGQSSSKPVDVMIKYDVDATASYTGGVPGFAATSPAATGAPIDANSLTVSAYTQHLENVSNQISNAVKTAVPAAEIGQTFTTAYGGVSAQVPANQIGTLLSVPGVVAVQKDNLTQPSSDDTDFIGATSVWPSLGGQSKAGSNVIFGILDTGIWPEHPSFADTGLPPVPAGVHPACQFGDGTDVAHLGPTFTCNRKLIGAYAFLDTYMSTLGSDGQEFCNNTTLQCSARDSEGHGTHTASTAAGDAVTSAPLYGVDRGPVSGVAPGARIIEYRVCLSQGCFDSDSVDAINQAILDHVNVINYSIGGPADPYTDAVQLAFLDAFHAGITVNASAGNDGPTAGTVENGSPWVTTVGASTLPRSFGSTLHLTADGGATFDMPGVTITNGISTPTPIVLAQNIPGEDVLCQTKLSAGSAATGKIVFCERGNNARIDKGFNVFSGGAAGMVLYNPINEDVETDNHWLPGIHVNGPDDALLAFIAGHTNVKAAWATGVSTPSLGDEMAAFSSRGPETDFIKPDLTAPGIQILAGMTPDPDETTPTNGPPGILYQAIAGTSMSSPHAAGASILVKAAHPDWSPAEIKSALMTSSAQDVVKEDGVTPADPFDDGAGSLRVNAAVDPTLVFNETYADYVASSTNPLHRIDLNLPSIDAPTMTGTITTKRTAIDVTGRSVDMQVSVQSPPGATITVSGQNPNGPGGRGGPGPGGPGGPGGRGPGGPGDTTLHFDGNHPTDFWVTISGPTLPDGQYFGRITLHPTGPGASGNSDVTIPIAFFRQQGVVSLTHACSPTSIPAKTGSSHCIATATNLSSSPANVDLTVTNLDKGKGLDLSNVTGPAGTKKRADSAEWTGTLSPSLAPTVNAITANAGVGAGYVPLSSFPGTVAVPAGDDTITNVTVPTFLYGGEPYSTIGVDSNGYLVVGGGDAADNTALFQTFPDPSVPNNVIAPFWTDLDATKGGSVSVNVLTDGTNDWIVVDWDKVPNFDPPLTDTHSMEVWLQVGTDPSDEGISMEYDLTDNHPGDPDVGGANSGAENRDGSSGVDLPAGGPTASDYGVSLSPPVAGGSATIAYDASSARPGTYNSDASLTSNVTPGTTQVVQTITVTAAPPPPPPPHHR